MDYYLTIILIIIGIIAFVIIIKHITFNTKFIYLLFLVAYIFTIIPVAQTGMGYYNFGLLNYFIQNLLADLPSTALNENVYIYFSVIGGSLILIKIITLAINKTKKIKGNNNKEHESESKIHKEKLKKSKRGKIDPFIEITATAAGLFDLGFYNIIEKETYKKGKKEKEGAESIKRKD